MKKLTSLTVIAALVTVLILTSLPGQAGAAIFNVKDHGATGDGKTLDSPAINKAITKCAEAGGGTVYFPAGTYLSGSIRLKSNITLHLDRGSVLKAAPNEMKVYDIPVENPWHTPVEYQDFGHSHWENSLIWGKNLENIAIVGHGKIDGSGMTTGPTKPGEGNTSIALKECRNILIQGITIYMGGWLAILPTGCDNMVIDGLLVDTNRDGINIDACRNVRISNCTINSHHDDAIVLKSSYALGYLRATENVTITNCMVSGYEKGTVFDGTYKQGNKNRCGRIKFGTESNGGFKNITITNVVFDECLGLALEAVDGGDLENITISNITMRDIYNAPIFIRLGNRARGPGKVPVAKVRNINISDIVVQRCYGQWGSVISGIPGHYIENVRISNVTVNYVGGGKKEWADILPPEKEKDYPELVMFGMMPSYGFYVRHVKDIEFNNINLKFDIDEPRPAVVCDDVKGLVLNGFRAQPSPNNDKMMILRDTEDVAIYRSPGMEPSKSPAAK